MNGYERMLEIMRKQGRKDNAAGLQLAVVQESGAVKLKGMTLEKDDYYVMEHMSELNKGDMVIIYQISDSRYIIIGKVVT